jgi:sterol desaturase/sphingolipid hydroxylase (fatty acid hydroxylase superfamily)
MDLPDPIQLASPIFILLILIEILAVRRLGRGKYTARDSVASISMGVVNGAERLIEGSVLYLIFSFVHRFRLFEIGYAWWSFVLLFFAEDFCFYWYHRLAHEHRVWWMVHVVHHSSQHYNLSTALRQPWINTIGLTWLPWLPLALLGFPPLMIFFQMALNLVYQFWIHTELIDRMPRWYEAIFNTPSHHRVHHAANPRYLDANYGGTLMIWDRLFGTFIGEEKTEPCRYGLVRNIDSFNPLKIALHEPVSLIRDIRAATSWRARLGHLFGPPGWQPDGTGRTSAVIKEEWRRAAAAP